MRWLRGAFGLLYLAGAFGSLVLEVIWARRMALVLGGAVEANACVLGAFMGGLGAGALAGAALGERTGRPRLWFAVAQLAGALLAPLPFLAAHAWPAMPFAAGLVVVLLAAVPAGLVFPLAARVRSTDGTGRGARAGILYALDTAGAVLGALAAGVWLIPALGLQATLLLAIATKVAVGLGSLVLPRPDERRAKDLAESSLVPRSNGRPPPSCSSRARDGGPPSAYTVLGLSTPPRAGEQGEPIVEQFLARRVLVLVGVQGFCLLGAEALWGRLLAFVLYRGSTTYALVAMLVMVLAGTSAGAWMVGQRERTPDEALRLAWRAAAGCGAALLSSLGLLLVAGPVPSLAAVGFWDLMLTAFACLPASALSGAVFAAACQAARPAGAARGAGRVLAVNSAAAVAGAVLVPLAAVPAIGLGPALAAVGVLPVVAAAVLARRWPWLLGLLVASAAAVLLVLAGPRWVRHLGTVLFYHEGPGVSVAVVEEPDRTRRLFVDGVAVAGTDLIMATDQKMLAHLPLLLHPDPRRALTVGFGAGGTSASMLLHPGLEVHCVEIAPGVLRAADFLQQANSGLLRDPPARYRLHLADARRWLARHPERFDLIVNDCTDLAYRADASLYTADFFRQVRAHLRPGGIGAAWVPLRSEAPHRVLRSVMASFAAAFDHVSLWVFDAQPTHFGILVGADRPHTPDLDRLRRALAGGAVRADLEEVGLADPWRLAASRQLDDRALRRFCKDSPLHTDDRPVVEFLAPCEHGDDASSYAFLQAAGAGSLAPVPPAVRRPATGDLPRLAGRHRVRPWLLAGHRRWLAGAEPQARGMYLRALRLAPRDRAVRTLLGLAPEPSTRPSLRAAAEKILEGSCSEAIEMLDAVDGPTARSQEGFLLRALAESGMGRCRRARRLLMDVAGPGVRQAVREQALSGLVLASLPDPLCRWLGFLTSPRQ